MKDIIEAVKSLSDKYEQLSEKTDQIFNTLKVKDYKKKDFLEKEMETLYKLKDADERHLINLVKQKAEQLGLEEKRVETLIKVHKKEKEVMEVKYEIENMVKNINRFQFNLRRNIEFATAFIEVKGKEIDLMFEVIKHENINGIGPVLLNDEL